MSNLGGPMSNVGGSYEQCRGVPLSNLGGPMSNVGVSYEQSRGSYEQSRGVL